MGQRDSCPSEPLSLLNCWYGCAYGQAATGIGNKSGERVTDAQFLGFPDDIIVTVGARASGFSGYHISLTLPGLHLLPVLQRFPPTSSPVQRHALWADRHFQIVCCVCVCVWLHLVMDWHAMLGVPCLAPRVPWDVGMAVIWPTICLVLNFTQGQILWLCRKPTSQIQLSCQ